MESRASRRPGFSLEALIAEAKRRARQRRLLVALFLLAVAVAVAAVALGSSGGGGSRSGGAAGGLGGASDGSQSVQVGAFALTVPRGFYQEEVQCPVRHCQPPHGPIQIIVSNHPLTAASSPVIAPNRVVLDLSYLTRVGSLTARRLPLDIHKLQLMTRHADDLGGGTLRGTFVAGDGLLYQVHVFEGSKTSPAARASILRALGSIRRSH